jgi:hypothetical protein
MQYQMYKAESHYSLGQNKSISMLASYNISPIPAKPAPYLTSSCSSHISPIPIDLSPARYYLSYEEYYKRIDEGCHLYYGGFNHIVHNCLNKPKVSSYPLCSAITKTTA